MRPHTLWPFYPLPLLVFYLPAMDWTSLCVNKSILSWTDRIQISTMAATHYEIQSFISKFSQLASFGYNSTLTFNTVHGKVYASFTAELGELAQPPTEYCQSFPRKKCKPSQYWRRQRRKEAAGVIAASTSNAVSTPAVVNNDSSFCDVSVEDNETSQDSNDACNLLSISTAISSTYTQVDQNETALDVSANLEDELTGSFALVVHSEEENTRCHDENIDSEPRKSPSATN